jgi:ATP-binding cassette subfamily B multidrug efflux pump
VFRFFEKRLHPYPVAEPVPSPPGFFAFLWDCTTGVRWPMLSMALLTAAISAFDALLFAILGRVVDWLSQVEPSRLWAERGTALAWIAAALAASIGVVALQTIVKHQTIAINLPMRLRWNFHRLMLGQSMAFYQDEFAGRITTKMMQTALAVRDTLFVLADVVVTMVVYVLTIIVLAAVLDRALIWPFVGWLVLYACAVAYFVPRLGRVGKAQADARSVMTGRITDAYANIATVKLFSHARREAAFARSAMQEFMVTGYAQMRLVSGLRDREPCLVDGIDSRHGRDGALALVARGRGRRRGGRGHLRWRCGCRACPTGSCGR